MSISQLGSINVTALQVPDVYIQIVPPQFLLNGVPSNILGLVGTASWGPVNEPVIVGDPAQGGLRFGPIMPRGKDLMTAITIGFLQGATAMKAVRVTDGTDTSATITIQTNCLTLTSKYTGSGGARCAAYIGPGSATNSFACRVAMPGLVPEMYDNVFKGVASVTVDTAGTGYTSVPIVQFSAPQVAGGRRATGRAVLSTTTVGSVVVDDPGTGYTSAPTVTFSGGGGTGAAATAVISVWPALADAINNGQSNARGPSELVIATVGAGTTAPTTASYTLAGGTDGHEGVTGTHMLGVDTLPRTGMYSLRNQDVSVGALVDLTDTTSWATQVAFGLAEGVYMILIGASGQSITSAATAKSNAGIDTFAAKVLLGDWVQFNDTANGMPRRLVSPQAFVAGLLSNLSPEQSTLNKPLYGIVATEKSTTGVPYTAADIQALVAAGIDVIANPSPGGRYFSCRIGHNASSNPAVRGDNYTRMTNFIATTLNRGMGIYIGALQSRRKDDVTRRRAKNTLDAFLATMANTQPYPMIDEFQVVLDKTNNADVTIGLGYMFAYVKVVYMSIVEFFVINLEGGQTVQIVRQGTEPLALSA